METVLTQIADRIEQAHGLLATPVERAVSPWAGLGAAGFAAISAVLMAGVMVLGPGIAIDERVPPSAVGLDG